MGKASLSGISKVMLVGFCSLRCAQSFFHFVSVCPRFLMPCKENKSEVHIPVKVGHRFRSKVGQ